MKLPLTNIDKFIKFNFNSDSFSAQTHGAKIYEGFYVCSDNTIHHYITSKENSLEGISLIWEENIFDVDYDEENYVRIIK